MENTYTLNEERYLKLDHPSMTKIKLIIGNGFDLACGLNSSYEHFFNSDESKFVHKKIKEWMVANGKLEIEDINIWDIWFYFLKNDPTFKDLKSINWKDVEKNISLSLGFNVDDNIKLPFTFFDIYNALFNEIKVNDRNGYLLKCLIEKTKFNGESISKDNFYYYLLNELVKFEKRFTSFLKNEMELCDYQNKARKMLTEDGFLKFNLKELYSIDTFNFTTPDVFNELSIKKKELCGHRIRIRHINGKMEDAIFGIDAQNISLSDPRYIFTKSFRKMKMLRDGKREEFSREFDNVVVFGHSLSVADYSYFFSILDKLNLNDFAAERSRFVVAISDFLKNNDNIIWSTLQLLDSYDNWKNPTSNRHGLIDILETSDRVGFAYIKQLNI